MAKGKRSPSTKQFAANDFVSINLVDPTTFATPSFAVQGTSDPSNATVSGVLTHTTTAATIPSNPPSVACMGPNGDWTLDFQDVPPGSYILCVNHHLPYEGADAKGVTVTTTETLTIGTPTTTTDSATVPVTNNSPSQLTVSAVITTSPAKHGKPRHRTIPGGGQQRTFKFENLPSNTDFTVTAYPVKGLAKGDVKTGKTKP